jgi:AAA family ATP:ADP antiporter
MSYIPLDADIRGQAKAAVDVVAARFGKSGASLIFIGLNAIPAFDYDSLKYVHIILGMFSMIMIAWIYSSIKLGAQFDAKTGTHERDSYEIEKTGIEKKWVDDVKV